MDEIIVSIKSLDIKSVSDGQHAEFFSNSPDLVRKASSAANRKAEVALIPGEPYRMFTAGWSTPLERFTALMSIDPENTTISLVPESVVEALSRPEGDTGSTGLVISLS